MRVAFKIVNNTKTEFVPQLLICGYFHNQKLQIPIFLLLAEIVSFAGGKCSQENQTKISWKPHAVL